MSGTGRLIAATCVLACAGIGASVAHAATRYVAVAVHGGNDNGTSNTCNNQAAPCLTVQHAVNKAVSGDTIQIGPGRFPAAVTDNSKALTFTGAGAGTSTSFDATADTYIDAGATTSAGLTLGNHDVTIQGLRIRGGGSTQAAAPAISPAGGSAVPTLTVTNDVVLQSSPSSPGPAQSDAISAVSVSAGTGLNITIAGTTIVAFSGGIFIKEPSGVLTISSSTILAPSSVSTAVIIPTAVDTRVPTTLTDDSLTGSIGVEDASASTTITRTTIHAANVGVHLYDDDNAASLTLRDSVVAPASGTLAYGVQIVPPSTPSIEVPTLDLTFDSILAHATPPAYALDAQGASPGTRIRTRNTILEAIDSGGGTGADEIAASDGLSWDLGTTDYVHTLGPGIPPAGTGTNISADPQFTDAANSDLTLAPTSPLLDRGDPAVVTAGETDVTGAPRAAAHTCSGAALPDLGAYEAPAPASCPPPPPPKPTLGTLTTSHKTFRVGSEQASVASHGKKKPPVGTTFTVKLNTAATLTLTLTGPTHTTLTLKKGHAGTDKIAFQGRTPKHKKFKPGKYKLKLVASNSSGASRAHTVKFTIAPG